MVSSRSALLFLISGLFVAGAALTGCADPEDELNDFVERRDQISTTGTTTTTDTGGCTVPAAGAIDGDYLLALSATLNPAKPILFLAQVTTSAMGDGLGFSMNLQALTAADRSTPVGAATDVGPFQVNADGSFVADLPPLTVPNTANPITGSEIQADATMTGSLCDPAEFICGTVTGTAIASITLNLDGSTFTMEKVPTPGAYPEPPQINCAGTLAEPL
ncbi:MAG TPA: hypothetical protein VLS89_17375 [Candidatus Nanopelagicales bacterium]|nr:hypothetical protein [Candidatus Nanopelagicales bacterium]